MKTSAGDLRVVSRSSRYEGHGTREPRRLFRFENLEVWQLARQLNRSVYSSTKKFPKDELFALTSQVRRASISISSNIAEGSGRNSDADFAHFLEIALRPVGS
jgi:hypothetical protein